MPDEERQGVCAQIAASAAGSLLNTRKQKLLHRRGWRGWQRKTYLLRRAAQVVLLYIIVRASHKAWRSHLGSVREAFSRSSYTQVRAVSPKISKDLLCRAAHLND